MVVLKKIFQIQVVFSNTIALKFRDEFNAQFVLL